VTWGRAYKALINYMKKNERESGVRQMNLISKEPFVSNRTHKVIPKTQLRCSQQLWLDIII